MGDYLCVASKAPVSKEGRKGHDKEQHAPHVRGSFEGVEHSRRAGGLCGRYQVKASNNPMKPH